ncbi:protein hydE [Photobacterium aphoticum]|uniref:Protein hydE n=1 Tax=Photobacterium aphoticum TaxID=754436 RepID=A0A090QST9_9GAMM|nr:protein hydE [Photobacterium aphoticum]
MAFRLATDGDDALVPKLAFGIMDSLADHLATWIEHLDGKHGIEQVVLAGNEMANECLAQRLAVRVGKNFPLFANRRLALDSSNLSVGALLLKQRRGRGW